MDTHGHPAWLVSGPGGVDQQGSQAESESSILVTRSETEGPAQDWTPKLGLDHSPGRS